MAISNSPEETLTLTQDGAYASDLRRRPPPATAVSAVRGSSFKTGASPAASSRSDSTDDSSVDTISDGERRDPSVAGDDRTAKVNGDAAARIGNGEDSVRTGGDFMYRPSAPAHRRVAESPLSSDAIFKQVVAVAFSFLR